MKLIYSGAFGFVEKFYGEVMMDVESCGAGYHSDWALFH